MRPLAVSWSWDYTNCTLQEALSACKFPLEHTVRKPHIFVVIIVENLLILFIIYYYVY